MSNETVSIPSYNVADVQDTTGLLDFFQKNVFQKLEKVAPAQVVSYDRNINRAVVQVLNYSVTSTGNKAQRKPLEDIPVSVFGGGGFCLGFPIKAGDIGILISCDCDISVWKKLLSVFTPATEQKHRYKNGIFFPLIINGFTLSANDTNAVVLSSVEGTSSIAVTNTSVSIKTSNIDLTGVLTINGQPYLSHTHTNGHDGAPTGGVVV